MIALYLQIIENDDDKMKFERLYIQYRDQMYHVALRILKNSFDAEDAVHQAFISIIKNLNEISSIKCPETHSYVVVIVERKAIDIIRGRSKYVAEYDLDQQGLDIPLPGDHGLADALARLPARYREILLLKYDCGYSTRELSQILGIKRANVQKLIWRAKRALLKQLEGSDNA